MNKFRLVSLCVATTLGATSPAYADWFIRGTQNAWSADPMIDIGSNTVVADDVVFDANGRFKFDRFGDWAENYGVGGRNGNDITVGAGTYDIEFYTDTKNWVVRSADTHNFDNPTKTYHFRGTPNGWVEGTLLTRVGNTTDYEICVNFTGGDANGAPRFKIDVNGAWGADAFPAQDVVVGLGYARVVVDGSTDSLKSVTSGLGENCSQTSPDVSDFRNRTMYFLFLDRFADGDPSNNNGNNPNTTSTLTSAGNESDWKKYWGGDIRGLIDKLDYLEALGVSAIWITPPYDNIDNSTNEAGYHGYWGRDFFLVDEHLGDWALIDELDAATEARGMKLVLDIALNHSNQDDQYEFGALYREGTFLADQSNTTWYHNNGAIGDCGDNDPITTCGFEYDDRDATTNKSLFNLTDFNHGVNSNSVADEYLIDAGKKWLDHGIDAFRIDAIKHIEPNFINRFSAAMQAHRPGLYIFGEWFDAGVGNQQSLTFLNENRGSELLDFKLRDAIEAAIADDISMVELNAGIEARPGAMNNREDWQPIFLDNHDATRTSVYLQTNGRVRGNAENPVLGKGFGKAFAEERQNLGMALVMTLPGIPTIYYGTEQNTTWFTPNNEGRVGHDPYNREKMPSFSQSTPAFTMIKALADLRKDSAAIARGSYAEKWLNGDVLVFERNEGPDTVVVAVNKGAARSITVSNLGLADGTYNSLVGGDTVTVSGGGAVLNLAQNEVVVLR